MSARMIPSCLTMGCHFDAEFLDVLEFSRNDRWVFFACFVDHFKKKTHCIFSHQLCTQAHVETFHFLLIAIRIYANLDPKMLFPWAVCLPLLPTAAASIPSEFWSRPNSPLYIFSLPYQTSKTPHPSLHPKWRTSLSIFVHQITFGFFPTPPTISVLCLLLLLHSMGRAILISHTKRHKIQHKGTLVYCKCTPTLCSNTSQGLFCLMTIYTKIIPPNQPNFFSFSGNISSI